MENKALHIVMRSILVKYGRELISKEVLVNFLADYNAFSDKATRRILSTLLQLGYGRKILILDQNQDKGKLEKIKSYAFQISEEGFQRKHVDYVFNCICYALGWIDKTSIENNVEDNPTDCVHVQSRIELSPTERTKIIRKLHTSIKETYKLIESGNKDVTKLALQRNLAESTIYTHINTLVEKRLLDVFDFIHPNEYDEIVDEYKKTKDSSIKPIYDHFCGKYNYEILRLAIKDYYVKSESDRGSRKQIKTPNTLQKTDKEAENLKKVNDSIKETYKLFKSGIESIQQLALLRHLSTGTICGHLSSLIENGLVDISKYVPNNKYDTIINAYKRTKGSSISEVYRLLNGTFTYEDIKLALSEYKRRTAESLSTKSHLSFVDKISKIRTSKEFFKDKCRIILSSDGYYLSLAGKYIKIHELLPNVRTQNGSIWLMVSKKHTGGFKVVHDYTYNKITLGEIWRTTDSIMFESSNNSPVINIRIKS